jgi:drug/metabolite transporter (DMT)-like permease
MKNSKGFLALLTAAIIFGSFGIWIRLLSHDFTNYQQIVFRYVIALVIASLILYFRKTKISIKDIKNKYVLLFGFAFSLSVIFYTFSILSTKIMVTLFAFYAGELICSFLIGIKYFKEKVDVKKIWSLVFAAIGLFFFVGSLSNLFINIGFLLGLIAGVLDTIANSFRKYLSGNFDRYFIASIPLVGGFVIAIIMILLSRQSLTPHISAASWGIGLLFGLLLFGVNYLLSYGFRHFDLNLGTIIVSSELFFASVFGFLIFGERPLVNEIIGGAFIVLAIIVSNIKDFKFLKRNIISVAN